MKLNTSFFVEEGKRKREKEAELKRIELLKQENEKNKSFLEKVGDFAYSGLKTAGNIATNATVGTLNRLEGIGDTIYKPLADASSFVNNNVEKLLGIKTANETEKAIKRDRQRTRDFVKKDLTQGLLKAAGWNDDVYKQWEDGSLVKRDNIGGAISQGIGGMLPQLLVGKLIPTSNVPLVNTKGLSTGKKVVETVKNMGRAALPQLPATATMAAGAYGNALQEAYQNDATEDEAKKYALGSSITEIATEWLTSGIPGLNGTGILDKGAEKLIDKATGKIKKEVAREMSKTILHAGYEMVGEGLEEAVSEIVSPLLKRATYDEKAQISWPDVFQSAIVGAITGGILNLPSTIYDIKSVDRYKQPSNGIDINQEIDLLNSEIPSEENNPSSISDVDIYSFERSDNDKINVLKESASQYFTNSKETHDLINTYSKIIEDKGYNVIFDDQLKSPNGNIVNAQVRSLENGEIEIKINPQSDRAGEFLIMHEITHAIETDSMKQLVLDYASKNAEFNDALESLKQTYGVRDVSSEVLADISGQLFGNQEFINSLSMEKPSIFRRIYNAIIALANKITGNSKESLFIRDLKNKWEIAYRSQNNKVNSTQFMMTGKKGAKNAIKMDPDAQFLLDNYYKALELKKLDVGNERIRQKTGWFEGKDNKWRFEIGDEDARIIKKLRVNGKYYLGDILEHEDLFSMYPKLKRVKVNFVDIKDVAGQFTGGQYSPLTNKIELNNRLFKKDNHLYYIQKILLHEIQHNIQKLENFAKGSSGKKGMEEYINNLGEQEARDTSSRMSLNYQERLRKIPSSVKINSERSIVKNKNKAYNLFKKKEIKINDNNQIPKEDLREILHETKRSIRLDDGGFRDKISNKKEIGTVLQQHTEKKYVAKKATSDDKSTGMSFSEKKMQKTKENLKAEVKYSMQESEIDISYRIDHQPSKMGLGYDLTSEGMVDNSIYSNPEWYADMKDKSYRESFQTLSKIRNNPEAEVTIYRATPATTINVGDWITLSKTYAQDHLERSLDGQGNIIQKKVKAKDIQWAGDDINEFGYFPDGDVNYSIANQNKWQQYIEKKYVAKGTRTSFEDVKRNDRVSIEQKLLVEKKNRLEKKYENEKKSSKKIISKEASRILQFSDYKTKNKFQEVISEFYDNPDLEKIKVAVKENFGEQIVEYIDENLKNIKREVRSTKIKIPDDLKKMIPSYNDFRKSNFGKLKLGNEGQSVGALYTQLSDSYPNIFSKDVVNELDQLNRLSEFMNEDVKIAENYKIDDKALEEASKYIFDSLKDKVSLDEVMDSISISAKEIRREKTHELREYVTSFLEGSDSWKDKKMGIQYKTNTMKRNLFDIMPSKSAERIYKNFIEPIFEHNSQMQTEINKYNSKVKDLKLNDLESTAVQMLGEYKYNPDTLVTGMQVTDFIEKNKLDYNKISKSVDVFRSIYDEFFQRVNQILKEFGYKEIDYRKGYFPHFTVDHSKSKVGQLLEKMGWKFDNNSIPTSIAGITDTFKPGKVWTAFSQERKGKVTDFNALQGMDTYLRGALEIIYFTEDIQKLRALENEIRYQHSDTSVQNRIDEIQSDNTLTFDEKQDEIDKIYATYLTPLNNFVNELRDYTNSIANKKSGLDRTMEAVVNRQVYSVMTNVSNRLSANMVGLNISSALTNFIPITQAFSQVKSKYLIKGLKEAIKSQVSADNFEMKSVFLNSRLNAAEKLYKTKLEKISDKANFLFEAIDSVTANTIVRGKYYENIAKGMSEYRAMTNADNFTRDLMAGRSKGEMPTIFNSKNPLVKVLTAFQLEVNNQYHYMFKDIPRDLKDEGMKKILGAFLKMFLGAYIYNQLAEKITGRKSAFSPGDTLQEIYATTTNKKLNLQGKSADILENVTQDVPFIGGFLNGGRLPISSIANPLSVIKGESTLGDETKKALFYTFLPFGGGQLKKTVEGIGMYTHDIPGSYTKSGKLRFEAKTDPLSVGQSILFGQYASSNASDYFSHAQKPLTEKQQQEIKKLKVDVNTYREYRDDFSYLQETQADKKKDGKTISGSAAGKKALQIITGDYTEKEKNYLLSQISSSDLQVSDLKKLERDENIFKYFFSLDSIEKKNFIEAQEKHGLSSRQLFNYETVRRSTSKKYGSSSAKEIVINYLSQQNLSDEQKYYLYSKDYGSEEKVSLMRSLSIPANSYLNTLKHISSVKKMYPGTEYSEYRRSKIFSFINDLDASVLQKVVLFKESGYSINQYRDSLFKYVESLKLSKIDKQKIWRQLFKEG